MKKNLKYSRQTLYNSTIISVSKFLFRCTVVLLLIIVTTISGQENVSREENLEYRIEKPGTITFTVGVKIRGKVEKPQVMIFLPKEKPVYKANSFNRSFSTEINEPLPFTPLVE